jgi:hypothetical protein
MRSSMRVKPASPASLTRVLRRSRMVVLLVGVGEVRWDESAAGRGARGSDEGSAISDFRSALSLEVTSHELRHDFTFTS